MLKKLRNNSKGFTIIEVMIVLAVAALILLIVLLAVPALQRNSRNTGIKSDASSVAGAINTYQSDNNGTAPNSIAGTGTVTLGVAATTCGASPANTETAKVQGSTAVSCVAAAPSGAGLPSPGQIKVLPGQNCSGTAATRSFAIYYATETSSGTTQQCLDS